MQQEFDDSDEACRKTECGVYGRTVDWRCHRTPIDAVDPEHCFWHSRRSKTAEEFAEHSAEERQRRGWVQGARIFGSQLQGVDLSGLKLVEASFGLALDDEGTGGELHQPATDLSEAQFRDSDFWRAQFRGRPNSYVNATGARFRNVSLHETVFDRVVLDCADFGGASLRGTVFHHVVMRGALLGAIHRFDNVELHDVTWDERYANVYEQQGDEAEQQGDEAGQQALEHYETAHDVYGLLKEVYARQGDLRTSGEFFYRQMQCQRKMSRGLERVSLAVQKYFWGYTQRPWRVLAMGLILLLVMAGVFSAIAWDRAPLSARLV